MAKIQKIIDEGIPLKRTDFFVDNYGETDEYYIDPSHSSENGIYTVYPIAETETFFYYICWNCQEVHVESKRYLTTDNKTGTVKCPYMPSSKFPVRYALPKDSITLHDAHELTLEQEWKYMEQFEKNG